MGGVIIFLAFVGAVSDPDATTNWRSIGVFGAAIACALLGFADDYIKIVRRRSLGLRARTKLSLLVAISLGAVVRRRRSKAHLPPILRLRFVDHHIDLGAFYPVLIYLVVAGHDQRA